MRAPGVKWTLLAFRRDPPDGLATASMYTVPVNHSLGPTTVSMLFLVIFKAVLLSRPRKHKARPCESQETPAHTTE